MNLAKILQTARQHGIGPAKIMEVLGKTKQYPNTLEGVKALINQCGGKEFLNAALNFADKPNVKNMLKQFGADEQVSSLRRELGDKEVKTDSLNSSLKDRLKKL